MLQLLVKLFPEIIIKSPPVRRQLTRLLKRNIGRVLRGRVAGHRIVCGWDRIDITLPDLTSSQERETIAILQGVSGIAQILVVRERPLTTLDALADQAVTLYADSLRGRRFAVRVKRQGRQAFSSMDVERWVGGRLKAAAEDSRVDLRQPEVTVNIEIQGSCVRLVEARHEGLGGYPMGGIGSALVLLSGGFDSAVAAHLAMKRGLRTHFVFFNLGGEAHEAAVRRIAWHLWSRFGSACHVRFVSVGFGPVVDELLRCVHPASRGVVLKRLMMRAATQVAGELRATALVTGESVSQVASQTLLNLAVIDRASELLVIRPLALADKEAIIQKARDIGVEGLCAHLPEYCAVVSQRPTTRAREHRIVFNEDQLAEGLLARVVAQARVLAVHELAGEGLGEGMVEEPAAQVPDPETVRTPGQGDVVIDLRHPATREAEALDLGECPVWSIPFYDLADQLERRCAEVDCMSADRRTRPERFLLYCDQGIMSRLQAGTVARLTGRPVALLSPRHSLESDPGSP